MLSETVKSVNYSESLKAFLCNFFMQSEKNELSMHILVYAIVKQYKIH